MTRSKGYGITNYRIHNMLKNMTPDERKELEYRLKKTDKKRYYCFKEWQKELIEILPKHKYE